MAKKKRTEHAAESQKQQEAGNGQTSDNARLSDNEQTHLVRQSPQTGSRTSRPEHAIVVDNYAELRDDFEAFAEGKYNFLIVIGNNGLGKSETIKELLAAANRTHVVFEGSPSEFKFYCDLYDNLNATVILDDVDPKFFRQSKSITYLKQLTETRTVKTLRWPTASTGEGKEYPSSFETTSRAIVLTNEWDSINEHVRAIEGRATTICFEPTPEEVHKEVGRWFQDQEVYDYVWENRRLITKPNMRLYVKLLEQKRAGRPWRKRGLEMLVGDTRLSKIAEVLASPEYKTNNQRRKAFEERGYGTRSTFYKLLKEFRYYTATTSLDASPTLDAVKNSSA